MSFISKFCQLVDGPQVFFKYSSRAPKVIQPLLTEVLPWQCQREKEIDCWLNNIVTLPCDQDFLRFLPLSWTGAYDFYSSATVCVTYYAIHSSSILLKLKE